MDKNPFKLNNLLKTPVTKFVISLNEHSSDSEDENEPTATRRPPGSPQTTTLKSTPQKDPPDKVIAYKMQASTVKSLVDKNTLRIRLQETDQHYNRIKKLINKKNLNVQQMKSRIVQGQLKLRKQQAEVKKLHAQYLAASKQMKENMKEISTLTNSLSTVQRGIEGDKKLMLALETKSRSIETNLKELGGPSDSQPAKELPTIEPDPDSMSLASSDDQSNLILEHNDTSVDRQESLFVQPSGRKLIEVTWPNEPARPVNLSTIPISRPLTQIKTISTVLNNQLPINQLQSIQPALGLTSQNPSNLITVPITYGLTSNPSTSVQSSSSAAKMDEKSISKIIDLNLDYTRRTSSLKKTPVKTVSSAKKITLVNGRSIQSPSIKKRPLNRKKNELLQKMLMIEERNEKEEIERAKKEEEQKKKLLEQQKEKDISELRQMLKNKKILSNAIISLKKDIRSQLKLNDKLENYDLFVNGLTLFLEHSLDKSFLLDNLTIKIDNKLFDATQNKSKKKPPSSVVASSVYSNNLVQSHGESDESGDQPISPAKEGSVLESIRAYRLSNNFEERYIKRNGEDFTMVLDSFFANKVNPYSATCNFDLNGKCNDDNCQGQHKNDFILDERQKIIDLLLYSPSISRYKGEVKTREDMNRLLKHLNEFVDNLEKKYNYNEMVKYLVKLIRISTESEESIITKTKIQMQQAENTTINEYISNQQQTQQVKNGENTFADFVYKFKIRDRDNVLTYSKMIKTTKQLDAETSEEYENKYKQRFFSTNDPEKNLEEYCRSNPTDVKCWIKLAYLQINSIHCKTAQKQKQLQNAVKVVVQALNTNRRSLELWRTYLYLLVNLWNYTKKEDHFEKIEKKLQFICKKIIEQYPSYQIWKYYLSLSLNYLNKELISSEILDEIQTNSIAYYDAENNCNKELISNAFLEMVLYKANLYGAINKHEKAKTYLASVLSTSIQPASVSEVSEFTKTLFDERPPNPLEDRKKYQETALLTNEDKVFLWLNYLYLTHHGRLPTEKFELFKQSFSGLADKKPFLVAFNPMKKPALEKLLGILMEAIKDCFFNIDSSILDYHQRAQKQIKMQMQQQNLITCLPLFHNLANLLHSVSKKKTAHQVFSNIATKENQILIPLLINKAIFEERNNYESEAFYTLGDTQVYKQDNFDVIYYLCVLHFKHGEVKYFNYEASKILRLFFDFNRSTSISSTFHQLLYRHVKLDNERMKMLERVDSKLWTLYLMSEILAVSEDNMDSVLSHSLSLAKLNKNTKSYTINLLHFLYLNFYAKTITDQERLNEFLEKLKYACLFIEDAQFQFYLLKHFSNCFFLLEQRFKYFLKFLLLVPQNKHILNHFLNLAFNEMNSKKICYQVLNFYVERKKLRNLLEPVHWYLVIYLAIDFKEHLNLHNYFQMAISIYPYNKQLWHYLLAYEVSQNHTEHVEQIRAVLKQLRMPDLEKQLVFD